jgi:predicted alpha-1,2-mannosidase
MSLSLAFCALALPAANVDDVNPYIGTAGGGTEYGGMMPLVTAPFGMTNWTAQSRENQIGKASYAHEDDAIGGFIGTHQPAVWMGDYGYVTLMPQLGDVKTRFEDRKVKFRREDEVTTPYEYRVRLGSIGTRMTATERCGFLEFAYPEGEAASLLVEATRAGIAGYVKVDPKRREIVGYNPDRMDAKYGPFKLPNFRGYFVIQVQTGFDEFGTYQGETLRPGQAELAAAHVGAYVKFAKGGTVRVRVGTSFISVDQARDNLRREVRGWDFDRLRDALRRKWEAKLSLIDLEGATEDERKIFYTGLYHALLYPRLFSEYGRYYSAFDDQIHAGESYTAFSLWDTFRAEHPLLTLIAPERVDGMIRALLQNYQEGGWMPKWPNPSYTNIMIGTPADSVVAEAVAKGFRGFDLDLAYRATMQDAMTPPVDDEKHRWYDREENTPYEARQGLTYLKRLGYVPHDRTAESVSVTLEGAYEDWCVAQVAKAAGRMDDYEALMRRAQAYRNVYHAESGFMRARNADGSWAGENDGLTEGDKWTYAWCVLHDMPGLVELMGGPERFCAKLDEHFDGGHNRHDNEPSHHYGYLYNYAGQPWKTQARVRKLAYDHYANRPDGLAGNEDCGQMSAWYLFTALGFYPVNPASAEYVVGSPLYRKVTLRLPKGKRFTVTAANNSRENVYVQSVRLNGKPLTRPIVTHAQIVAGGRLEFVMGPRPSAWAADFRG